MTKLWTDSPSPYTAFPAAGTTVVAVVVIFALDLVRWKWWEGTVLAQ